MAGAPEFGACIQFKYQPKYISYTKTHTHTSNQKYIYIYIYINVYKYMLLNIS